MCKTNHIGLPQVLDHAVHPVIDFVQGHGTGHLPNSQRYLGHTSEPLTPTQTLKKLRGGWWGGGLCDFSVAPSPNWVFGFWTALGFGLGLRDWTSD